MKTAIIADVHLGNFAQFAKPWSGSLTTRAKLCLETFDRAYSLAESLGCREMRVAGDLFHVSEPPPQLTTRAGEIMNRPFETDVTLGNHDMNTFAEHDNACSPLTLMGQVWVSSEPSSGNGISTVPFKNGNPMKWLPIALKELRNQGDDSKALVLHMGLSTDRTPGHMAHCQGAIKARELENLATKYGYNRVFLGDWHNPDKWCPKKNDFQAHQISTLIPASFSDAYKDVGRMVVYDTETQDVAFHFVNGPRFLKLHKVEKELPKAAKELSRATDLFVQLQCTPEDYQTKKDQVVAYLAAHNLELLPRTHFVPKYDTAKAKTTAEYACGLARSADSLQGAVGSWILGRGLEVGDQAAVQDRVDHFIRKAGGGGM